MNKETTDVRVQSGDFDLSTEVARLRAGDARVGAVVSFVGTVRDMNDGDNVAELELEHYPGMTERALHDIVEQARARWPRCAPARTRAPRTRASWKTTAPSCCTNCCARRLARASTAVRNSRATG